MRAYEGSGINVAAQVDCVGDRQNAYDFCKTAFAEKMDVIAVFCSEEQSLLGVVQAAQEENFGGLIYSADATPDMYDNIANGVITGVGAVNPMNIGVSAAEKCAAYLAFQEVEAYSFCQTILINADNVAEYFSEDGWQ